MLLSALEKQAEDRELALRVVSTFDGWLTQREAARLYDAAAAAIGPIVEIGSCFGKSTIALAMGSRAGSGQRIVSIDSFGGVSPLDRPTDQGQQPGWNCSSAELLRANLESVGVADMVDIVPLTSEEAILNRYVPADIGVLWIDGDHSEPAVMRDFELYLPRVKKGGVVIVHDCTEGDPGVVAAVDAKLMSDTSKWTVEGRADSAVIFVREDRVSHKVRLVMPGPKLLFGTASGLMSSTIGVHDVMIKNRGMGWDDMAALWIDALNAALKGTITHFAMLHSDIMPEPGWLDTLLSEMGRLEADMISAIAPLKNEKGLTSAGIGTMENRWAPFRRFTMREVMQMPETFGIGDTPYPDKVLLHNSGCIVCDLRNPKFFSTDENGVLLCNFAFPIQATRGTDGMFVHQRESEDWYFSRQIHALGIKSYVTRKVKLSHFGLRGHANDHAWGDYACDEDTRANWGDFHPEIDNSARN